nr:PREDICTED: zinc finger matrin-type protein 5 isoform X3 [Equus przewalskii]
MGKRYFCDYCDRSFQDNLHNRKKHLNGLQHLKAKKVWYDMFRDAAAILLDEQNKRPCRKFLLTGLNPSDPLSSSTPWAGHQFRNCRHPCGHPHPGGGPCSPASSGAEPLIPTCSALESVTINIRAHSGEAEPPSCCAPWSL